MGSPSDTVVEIFICAVHNLALSVRLIPSPVNTEKNEIDSLSSKAHHGVECTVNTKCQNSSYSEVQTLPTPALGQELTVSGLIC